ncbi:hypothetical protein ABEB36_004146 [Hypothenemus hampei]|uniref:Uncharacterized protein n=1 Tax=Hypothenemus hampei TaxID=57062 RepID=A0ABD1F2C2_HYPHA
MTLPITVSSIPFSRFDLLRFLLIKYEKKNLDDKLFTLNTKVEAEIFFGDIDESYCFDGKKLKKRMLKKSQKCISFPNKWTCHVHIFYLSDNSSKTWNDVFNMLDSRNTM